MGSETRLALDGYWLLDPQTQRIRFTRIGKDRLEKRLARLGLSLARIQTLPQLKRVIAIVTLCEYKQLSPAQRDDETLTDAIDDLSFITDHADGLPLVPITERRRQMREAETTLLGLIRRSDQSS